MKHKLSVFNYSYNKKYYLFHPWKLIKEFFQNCYHAYRRAVYGWTWEDCWNWNTWFLEVTPPMLRHMADYGVAYPGHEPFDTSEKWNDWLHSVADVLESLQEENWDTKNEFAEEFFQLSKYNRQQSKDENGFIHVTWSNEGNYEEIKKLYFERQKELNDEWDKLALDTGMEIFSNLKNLWD